MRNIRKKILESYFAIALLSILLILCLVSLISLTSIKIDPKLSLRLPDGPLSAETETARNLFPERSLVIASLPVGEPFSAAGIAQLVRASNLLERLGTPQGSKAATWRLSSALTMTDFHSAGGEMISRPLILGVNDDPVRVRSRFAASPLYSSLYLSDDRRAWTFLLDVSNAERGLLERLSEARAELPEFLFAGIAYSMALNGRILKGEFFMILIGTAIALFVAEYLIFRKLRAALLLWVFSLIPALILLGVFVATGTPLRLHLALAPGLALCLSTSYVVHLYHGWRACGFDAWAALRRSGRMIALDATTTVLGFSSLYSSPITELREIATFAIAAALIPLATTTLGLSSCLLLASRGRKAVVDSDEGLSIRPASPRARLIIPGIWAVAAALLTILSLRIESGGEVRDQFLPGSAERAEIDYFARSYNGLDEVGVVFDTGKEYGLVEPSAYNALRDFESQLRAIKGVGAVHGYCDAVGEILARWQGVDGVVDPRSREDIGEALEILSSGGEGSFARVFVDADWSAARLRLSMNPSFSATRDLTDLRASILAAYEARGLATRGFPTRPLLEGLAVENGTAERLFIDGQVSGDILFFATLVAALALVFKSIKKALVIALAPATGLIASLAIMAACGWSLSSLHAVALAVVLGTGVDNAIMLSLGGWTSEARSVSAEAALLVACGFTAFLCSSSYFIVQTAVACMTGLAASTLVANSLVPVLLASPEKR